MIYLPGSYQQGFAPRDFEPRFPELWRGCVFASAPLLGPTGGVVREWSGLQNHGTLTNMSTNDDWVVKQGLAALDFDGANDYVSYGTIPNTARAVTVYVHIMLGVVDANFRFICGNIDATGGICETHLEVTSEIFGHSGELVLITDLPHQRV
jgi:hypothetical protein